MHEIFLSYSKERKFSLETKVLTLKSQTGENIGSRLKPMIWVISASSENLAALGIKEN